MVPLVLNASRSLPGQSQRLPFEAYSNQAAAPAEHAVSLQHGCSIMTALYLAAAEHAKFHPAHA